MSKLRVYEVAKELGMDNKALVALFQSIGVADVKNHMSVVSSEHIDRVKRQLDKGGAQKPVEQQLRAGVVKRRGAPSAPKPEASSPRAAVEPPPPPVTPAAPPPEPVRSSPKAAEPPAVVEAAPEAVRSSPKAAEPPLALEAAPEPVRSSPKAAEPPAVVEVAPEPARSSPKAAEPPPVVESPPAASPVVPVAAPLPEPVIVESPAAAAPAAPPARPSSAPKTGIDVWEGRPGVPMPQVQRGPVPRRVQFDAKGPGAMGSGPGGVRRAMGPGNRMGPNRGGVGGARGRGVGAGPAKSKSHFPGTQERSAQKKIVKIEDTIGLQQLAARMGVKATELLMKLMRLGMTGVNINSTLDSDTSKIVASEFGWEVEDVAVSEEEQLLAAQGLEAGVEDEERELRPPVVTVMGHVDHGKTSLLDRIRKANVAQGEAGGITQHIGAYSVETAKGRVTFLDTPGHEAFTAMRMRGAQTTDVVILVVAADDGVMPQTREAVAHAKAAKVPIVVAINKCDKPDAQPDRVRRELSEVGLVPESWGGDAQFAEVSALTGAGVDELLELVALQSEVLELKANPNKPATAVVVEAELDRGKGPVATVLVQDGTLNRGDILLVGPAYGKVRAMLDDRGRNVASAKPSTPVSIIGLSDVPSAGDIVLVVKDLKKAQELAESRKVKERHSLMPSKGPRMTIEELQAAMATSEQVELKLIIKADVQGSVEAVSEALTRLSTAKVKVSVVQAGVGAITEGDVNLAVAAGAIIIGFNVRPAGKAAQLAQQERVEIRQYSIIYNVVDEVKAAMEGKLAPTFVEKKLGRAEVRAVFKLSKAGPVAGCMIIEGLVKRNASVRVLRAGEVVHEGKISSLKRFKEDVKEVKEGFDCGIALDAYSDYAEGDVFEAFELEQVKQTL